MLPTPTPDALHVLYVEDDPDIRVIGRIALADIGGLSVDTCNNGEDALTSLQHLRTDLLLLDVMMPGMDGLGLLQEIRRRQLSEAPVIFMTGRVDYADVQRYRDMGAIGVIKKPFDPLTLADDLKQMLSGQAAQSAVAVATAARHRADDEIPLISRLNGLNA